AQRAAFVVIAARTRTDGLGHRDLHVVDMSRVPDGLEQDIGKAQGKQVLDRLFAEVVVDAIDLIFGEDLADFVVDLDRRLQIVAGRLFDHHARIAPVGAAIGDVFAGRTEQIGCDGEIEGAGPLRVVTQLAGEIAPARLVAYIGRHI